MSSRILTVGIISQDSPALRRLREGDCIRYDFGRRVFSISHSRGRPCQIRRGPSDSQVVHEWPSMTALDEDAAVMIISFIAVTNGLHANWVETNPSSLMYEMTETYQP